VAKRPAENALRFSLHSSFCDSRSAAGSSLEEAGGRKLLFSDRRDIGAQNFTFALKFRPSLEDFQPPVSRSWMKNFREEDHFLTG